jgi:hypothetical protein
VNTPGTPSPDTLDTHARAKRSRSPKRTQGWQERFLARLRQSPNVSAAAQMAGIDRTSAYWWRDRHPDFSKEWDEAIQVGVDALQDIAWARATSSTNPSDRLMELLLKAHRPELYGQRIRNELTGAGGGPVEYRGDVWSTDEERAALIAAMKAELARREAERAKE